MQKKEEEIKMAVTKREDRKFKFETLQLHVGQEQPDPATDARAVPIFIPKMKGALDL